MKSNVHVSPFNYWRILSTLVLFKAFGLATLSISYVGSKKKGSTFTISFIGTKWGILYNLLFCSLKICSNYFTVPYLYNRHYFNRSLMTVVIEVSQDILGSLMICSIVLYYCMKQSSIVRIGNYMMIIQKELRQLRYPWKRKNTFVTLLVVYLINMVLLLVLLYTENLAFQTGPLSWIADVMPTTIAGWLFIQYFSVLILIKAMFLHVNNCIQSICRSWSADVQPESFYKTRRVFISTSKIQSLLQLRDIHDHLCIVSTELAQFYSMPALFGILYVFYGLIYNMYYLLEPLLADSVIVDIPVLINTTIWIIIQLYPIGLLTNKVTETINESGKTGNFVHALLHSAIDTETKSELLHQKIRFTANGYFSLDNTLFQAMLAAATTYLVILIQFQMDVSASHNCHCNCTQ